MNEEISNKKQVTLSSYALRKHEDHGARVFD